MSEKKKDKKINRRQALCMGVSITTAAVLGSQLVSSKASTWNVRSKVPVYDVCISNVSGMVENNVRISDTKESRVRNVNIVNIAVNIDRGTKYKEGLFVNRPTSAYPEIVLHGNPGCSIRYADNVSLSNCNIKWGDNRFDYLTHALEFENVKNLKFTHFVGKSAHPNRFEDIVIR